MTPHLHPRSSATTTLFASTLAASFIIVSIPHVFPCPAPRKGYLDQGGKMGRQRRARTASEGPDASTELEGRGIELNAGGGRLELGGELKSLIKSTTSGPDPAATRAATAMAGTVTDEQKVVRRRFQEMEEEAAAMETDRRECPMPKPRGKIGELLGFEGRARDKRRRRLEEEK